MRIFKILIPALFISVFSCSDSTENDSGEDSFDRKEILSNTVNNIILPAYIDFETKLGALNSSAELFSNQITVENLEALQSAFVSAYLSWQHIEMFNITKAEEIFYYKKMNIYPANVSRIESNITTGANDYDTNINQYSAQGFPAVDYLLYGLESTNSLIVDIYAQNEGNNPYMDHLVFLIQKMVSNTTQVIDDWNTKKDSFINNSGNTSASSLNMLANDFVFYYEKGLRANKIGIPSGVYSGVLPQNIEGYYNQNISKVLAIEALEASYAFFNGQHFNSTQQGESLASYIDYLDGNSSLKQDILNSMTDALLKLYDLDDNFVNQINSDNIALVQVFDTIQQGVVKLKTNMLSLLGISIDYYDADGD